MTTSNPTPNSPQELLSLNNTPEPTLMEQVESLMGECDYSQTLQVCRWLCNNLLTFHQSKVQELTESGECGETLVNFTIDSTYLWTCDQLLRKVD